MLEVFAARLFSTFVCMPQTMDLVLLENNDRSTAVCAASPLVLAVAPELAPGVLISSVFYETRKVQDLFDAIQGR